MMLTTRGPRYPCEFCYRRESRLCYHRELRYCPENTRPQSSSNSGNRSLAGLRTLHRAGQMWSGDLAISVLIFTIACTIAFTMLTNTINDDEYARVRSQAANAAELLIRDGYPSHWTAADVMKAGLVTNKELSLRKVREFATLTPAELHTNLRLTNNVLIYFTNGSNSTIGIFGDCAVTDAPGSIVVASNNTTVRLYAFAVKGNNHSVTDSLNAISPTLAPSVDLLTAIEMFPKQDVILLEDGILNASTAGKASLRLEDASKHGMTFIVIGDPGSSVLGIVPNWTQTSNITVQGTTGTSLGFLPGESISVAGNISTIELPGTNIGDQSVVRDVTVIATASSGKTAYATWLYNDARVWYFATADGTTSGGTAISDVLTNLTRDTIEIDWPVCSEPTIAVDSTQVAAYTRMLPFHGTLLTMHLIVWRRT